MDRATEYLRLLQEKNRLKKLMSTKSKEEQMKEELEKGFSTHFRGAHAAKEAKQSAQVVSTVKPVTILSRLAQSSRFGWKSDNRPDGSLPGAAAADDSAETRIQPGLPAHDAEAANDYTSDFETLSDVECERDTVEKGVVVDEMSTLQEVDEDEEVKTILRARVIGAGADVPQIPPKGLDGSVPLDASLQLRVKELSSAQKLKLLQLLEQDVTQDVPAASSVGWRAPGQTTVPVHEQSASREFPTPPLPVATQRSTNQLTTTHYDTNTKSQGEHGAADRRCSVRVRVTSGWDGRARFVCLRAMQLHRPAEREERDGIGGYKNMLPALHCKVLSGMRPLPASSDSVRTLDALLGSRSARARPSSGRNQGTALWRGPISPGAPLELVLDNIPWDPEAELALWSCAEPPLNCTAARDVDVFVDGRCVWSGQLPEPNADDELTATLALRVFSPRVSDTPLTVVAVADDGGATASPAKTVANATNLDMAGLESSAPLTLKLGPGERSRPDWLGRVRQQEPAKESPERTVATPKKTPRRPRSGKLSASETGAVVAATGEPAMGSPIGATRTPRRVRAEFTEAMDSNIGEGPVLDSAQRGVGEGSAGSPAPGSPAKAARRGRAPRRDRPAAADHPSPGVDAFSTAFDAATAGPQLRREREVELRKSLDSLALHEHFNLGRLSASKLPPTQRLTGVTEGGTTLEKGDEGHEEAGEQSADFAMAAAPNIAGDSLNCPSTPLRTLIDGTEVARQREQESPPSLRPHGSAKSELHLPSAQQSRSQKIDQVQEKINSTIAGLAQIMQGFSSAGPGSTGVLQRGGVKKSGTETMGEGVGGADIQTDGLVTGNVVALQVYSNWGDEHYVGLNGIELYGPQGNLYTLPAVGRAGSSLGSVQSISAFPRDLNIIPDTSDDPRRVGNLLDGVNFTKNDLHSWLAPQLPFLRLHHPATVTELPVDVPDGCLAVITITFDRPVEVAMCRLFNYNRSRARNQRGVRWCKILVQGKQMWEGEVKKASGQLLSESAESQVIFLAPSLSERQRGELLTHLVGSKAADGAEGLLEAADGDGEIDLEQSWAEMSTSRPKTSAGIIPAALPAAVSGLAQSTAPIAAEGGVAVNMTFAASDPPMPQREDIVAALLPVPEIAAVVRGSGEGAGDTGSGRMAALFSCRLLRIDIDSTWGDPSYAGLCGLQVLVGNACVPLPLTAVQLCAKPRDLSEIGCFDDPRVLANLLNGCNDTADDTKMWLIPFTRGAEHFIEIDLGRQHEVAGLRLWNYNKASEHVLRGCRDVRISADRKVLFRCTLRPGPGCDGVRYGQNVLFADLLDICSSAGKPRGFAPPLPTAQPGPSKLRPASYLTPVIRQDYETPLLPTGSLWRFTLFDNYNDQYFVGLDAIEFYDPEGRLLDTASLGAFIQAVPHSVQDVQPDHAVPDPRLPEQLLAPPNQAIGCGWLAPLSRCMTPLERAACAKRLLGPSKNRTGGDEVFSFPANNVIMVMFPQPVTVAAVKLFNYSKTPYRGARDFLLDVDGSYLYMGTLLRADKEKSFPQSVHGRVAPGSGRSSRGQSVLFSSDPRITSQHKETVAYCGAGEQDLLCINERQVMVRSKAMYDTEPPNTSLEGVRSDLQKRPVTAVLVSGAAGVTRR